MGNNLFCLNCCYSFFLFFLFFFYSESFLKQKAKNEFVMSVFMSYTHYPQNNFYMSRKSTQYTSFFVVFNFC